MSPLKSYKMAKYIECFLKNISLDDYNTCLMDRFDIILNFEFEGEIQNELL